MGFEIWIRYMGWIHGSVFGLGVWGSEFGVSGTDYGLGVWGTGFDLGLEARGLGFGFGDWSLGLGFRGRCSGSGLGEGYGIMVQVHCLETGAQDSVYGFGI